MTSDFGNKLAALCAIEIKAARGDHARMASMTERLVSTLALSIAISVDGNADGMSEILEGVNSFLYECAADHAKVVGAIFGQQSQKP